MDEEIKYTDDLEVEKVENSYKTVSLKESDLELKDNRSSNKKQKTKKGLKTKILACALGLGVLAGGVAGVKTLKDYYTTGNGAYNKILEDKFEQVNESLYNKMDYACTDEKKVKFIKFCDDNNLEIFYDGGMPNPIYKNMEYFDCFAIFKYATEYYNNLVNAEQSGNLISYLDALNNLFDSMQYVRSYQYFKADFVSKIENTEENNKKLSELFKLDTKDTNKDSNIVKQIGFLPYDIQAIKWEKNDDERTVNYSFKLTGISYCQTKNESHDEIKSDERLFVDNSYEKNHVKTYFREMVVSGTYYFTNNIPLKNEMLRIELQAYLNGTKKLKVETTYFEEVDIFSEFLKMKETKKFKYEKPADLDLTK